MHGHRLAVAAAALTVLGCATERTPTGVPDAAYSQQHAVTGRATGGGHYDTPGLHVQFSLSAIARGDGSASGEFHHQTSYDGLTADFHGRVTCLAVDDVTHRAWIGGVVTLNHSTDPDYAADIYQPGHDIWFRVVDYGEGSGSPPDRSTFVGFEGSAGIKTSAEYCAVRLWAAGDARTWPVTGNIQVAGH